MEFTLEENKVQNKVKKCRLFFESGRSKSVAYRREALIRLKKVIEEQEDAICDALYKDFKKPKFESLATETQLVLSELRYVIKNLENWCKLKKVQGSWSNFPSSDWVQYEPYGCVLIMAPWNYPFMLVISPLVGALAAGNSIILKPSEFAPNTSILISKIVEKTFESGHVNVVEGGIETSQELLDQKWDYIFFTGSTRVGKIIYQKAAERLTPVTLELGGKNPCIIDETANIKLAAKRIIWGKFLNAGQTCIAPDYILIHSSIKEVFITELIKRIKEAYGEKIENSPDYARIATKSHFERLRAMLADEKLLFGGKSNDSDYFMEPTLVDEPSLESKIMEDEIFGPVLPIISYKVETEIDHYINNFKKPLALYVFSKRSIFQNQIMTKFPFGGGAINDTVIQITNKKLPFGGVGNSGIGGYHGRHSFELFSHQKSIIKKANWLDLPFRYAPYKLADKWVKKFKHLI